MSQGFQAVPEASAHDLEVSGGNPLALFGGFTRALVPPRQRMQRRRRLLDLADRAVVKGRVAVEAADEIVREAFLLRHGASPRTLRTYRVQWGAFVRFVKLSGIGFVDEIDESTCSDWIYSAVRKRRRWEEPSSATTSLRHTILRQAFMVLADHGIDLDPETAGPSVARGKQDQSRPLTADEMDSAREVAFAGLFPEIEAAAFAMSEAGGDADEIAAVCVSDLDLDAGTVRFGGPNSRVAHLAPEAFDAIRRLITEKRAGSDDRIFGPASQTPHDAAMAVSGRLRRLLARAGLADQAGVTPRSIRLGAARAVYEAEGIEAAASFLGARSLDRTSAALGGDWPR